MTEHADRQPPASLSVTVKEEMYGPGRVEVTFKDQSGRVVRTTLSEDVLGDSETVIRWVKAVGSGVDWPLNNMREAWKGRTVYTLAEKSMHYGVNVQPPRWVQQDIPPPASEASKGEGKVRVVLDETPMPPKMVRFTGSDPSADRA